jgi:hypothetical protein
MQLYFQRDRLMRQERWCSRVMFNYATSHSKWFELLSCSELVLCGLRVTICYLMVEWIAYTQYIPVHGDTRLIFSSLACCQIECASLGRKYRSPLKDPRTDEWPCSKPWIYRELTRRWNTGLTVGSFFCAVMGLCRGVFFVLPDSHAL